MKLLKRRMTFQLTPLLDLLLIVIFAQFLDVDQKSQADAQAVDSAESRANSVEQRAAEAESKADRAQTARDDLAKQLEAERKRFDEQLEHMERQQEQFGDLVNRLFRVPKETVDEAIKAVEAASTRAGVRKPVTEEQIARIRNEFDRLAKTRGRETLQHALTFEQMTRRLEIWRINLERDGRVSFTTSNKKFPPFRFRDGDPNDPDGGEDAATAEANFSNGIYDRYKTLAPHGKSIVLVLFQCDRKISYFYYRPLTQALPRLIERLQRDSQGSTRYEMAIMGDIAP